MAASATIDEQERLVSRPDAKVLFMSRRSELRLTKKSRYPIRDPNSGEVIDFTPGEVVAFTDGQVRFNATGTVTIADTLDGGEAEIDAEQLTAWLLKHRLYGNRHEGFWRVDPTAPAISGDEMKALMKAAMMLDVPALERALEDERAGWDRADVIETIEERLADARTLLEQAEKERAEAEAAAEAERAKAEAERKAAEKAEKERVKKQQAADVKKLAENLIDLE